jgi:hypothetical protein
MLPNFAAQTRRHRELRPSNCSPPLTKPPRHHHHRVCLAEQNLVITFVITQEPCIVENVHHPSRLSEP